MEVKVKTAALAIVGIALLSYATGRYLQPAKVVTKIVTQTKEVVVTKYDVQTVTQEVDNPNGTITKTTTVTDKTVESNTDTTTIAASEVKTAQKPQWMIGGSFIPNPAGTVGPAYGVDAEHRFIGPIFLGAGVNTNKEIAIKASIEF